MPSRCRTRTSSGSTRTPRSRTAAAGPAGLSSGNDPSRPRKERRMAILEERETHLRENPLELARRQLRKVADTFEIEDNLVNVLRQCKKSIEVTIPTQMDDGS